MGKNTSTPSSIHLPIDSIKEQVCALPESGRLVLSSPTGSGKSTQVPRWFRNKGRVLVVEPRRVACRSLAARVAELDGHSLGQETGYVVRDENRTSTKTSVLFATPGVVLRMIQSGNHLDYSTVIIDEFHERSLDTDLLLALLRKESRIRLIIMSATLDGDAIAKHLEGTHLHAEGRLHPVETHYIGEHKEPPGSKQLESRINQAMDRALNHPGDILVFLPGKAEISTVCQSLSKRNELTVLPLHGGLTLAEQAKIFETSTKRKVIVSTNVAETSLTVPGIGIVIDSGLVRQTRYHNGRGFLSLVPVAADSAAQRAGRAGRTGPGVCFRLWSKGARLEERTRPEIHRESLVPLMLSAISCGYPVETLEFLSPPKPYATEQATMELQDLGAFHDDGSLTIIGKELFKLPMDPGLGRLLIESRGKDNHEDMVDLVAGLAVGRNLFRKPRSPEDEDDLRIEGSDALAWILALRIGDMQKHHLDPFAVKEARRISNRLRNAFKLKPLQENKKKPNMEELAQIILSADRRTAHVARPRGKMIGWSNGGTEIEVGRESALDREKWSAVAVLASRAMKTDKGTTNVIATCVLPLPLPWLVRAGLGRDRVSATAYVKGKLEATIERVYARKVIGTRKNHPTGPLAREALVELLLRGSLFRKDLNKARACFDRWKLAEGLASRSMESFEIKPIQSEDFEQWVSKRVNALGVETGEDIELLSGSDFSIPRLDSWIETTLDKTYPATVTAGDATYRVEYHLHKRTVCLCKVSGSRKELPRLQYLPRFKGFAIEVEDRGKTRRIRERQ